MKFTDAIRQGARLKPQGFQGMTWENTCVLQAASEGAGINPRLDSGGLAYGEIRETWPFLAGEEIHSCPVCSAPGASTQWFGPGCLLEICYHLNDTHKWTREAIADYIDTLKLEEA